MCQGIDTGFDWAEAWGPVSEVWCPLEDDAKGGFDCVACPFVEFVYQSSDPNERDILQCTVTGRLIWLFNSKHDPTF